jgi:hypothetical protein
MVLETIRLFTGEGPSASLVTLLAKNESCFARFAHDPEARLWVCARVGDQVYGTLLGHDEEWVRPGSGELHVHESSDRVTRRLAPEPALALAA